MKSIFTPEQEKLADIILENNHLSPLNELYSKEIKELAVIMVLLFRKNRRKYL